MGGEGIMYTASGFPASTSRDSLCPLLPLKSYNTPGGEATKTMSGEGKMETLWMCMGI